MADAMVLKTQQWLNQTYANRSGYVEIEENGKTGWNTIYALMRAFQIELGITATSTNFGPTTTANFNARFPNGVIQQSPDDETEDNIYAIIQGACWCKGYSTGASSITKHFYSGTGRAIKNLKEDAGCSDTTSTVTLNVMKALLSMKQFKIVVPGTLKIRSIQRELNAEYEDYIGLGPCDGLYGREMNKNLIKVLQAIEGYSVENATGNFGSGTKAHLPILPNVGHLEETVSRAATKLLRYCLCCNGYDIPIDSSEWDLALENCIKEFQNDMCIVETGNCDVNTWMALLLSTGNPDRPFTACDTAYGIRGARIQDLKDRNITAIGRYIVGGSSKELDFEEEKTIIDNGFQLIPIYQKSGTATIEHFSETEGLLDAHYAYLGAKRHCIPENAIIYFAVDFDPLGTEIANIIVPYFKVLKENLGGYRIGVYGTRNVCSQVMDKGYADTCYVSDMSTGFSGNMGFKMPENWNFDQFGTVSITNSEGTWAIDKVANSGKFEAVTALDARYLYDGEVIFTGSNTGRTLQFGGSKLRLNVRVTDENDEDIEGVAVLAMVKSVESLSVLYDVDWAVYAPADGTVHDFTETLVDNGEHYPRDYMKISEDAHYYVKYTVFKDGVADPNQRVKVNITIQTT